LTKSVYISNSEFAETYSPRSIFTLLLQPTDNGSFRRKKWKRPARPPYGGLKILRGQIVKEQKIIKTKL